MRPLNIGREIARIRNQQGDNWLAIALQRIQEHVNALPANIIAAQHTEVPAPGPIAPVTTPLVTSIPIPISSPLPPPFVNPVIGGVHIVTSTTHTIASTDNGELVSFNNASSIAVTLPDSSTLPPLFFCAIENTGIGVLTLTPAVGTIDGAASLSLSQGQGIFIYSDQINWYTERGVAAAGGVNLQTGTTYALTVSDLGKLVSFTNSSAIALSLPAISSLPSRFYCWLENRGVGALTITPNTETIDGAANLVIGTNQGIGLYTDGLNWYTERGLSFFAGGANLQSGTTYTVLASDNGKLVSFTNAAVMAVTLPHPNTLVSTFYFWIENRGAGSLVVNSTSPDTIDGAVSIQVPMNNGLGFYTDGANWYTMRGLSAQFGGVNIQTGTTYTIQLSDAGKMVILNNTSAVAVTLPTAASSWANFKCSIFNYNVGPVTITPQTGTIGGATSLTLAYYEAIDAYADSVGGNWWPQGGIFPSGVNTQTGTSYGLAEADIGKLVTLNNASAVAVSLPGTNVLGNQFHCAIANLGAGVVTITPGAGTIDGGSSVTLSQSQGIELYYDGTNYFTLRGLGSGGGGGAGGGVNLQSGTTYTVVASDSGKLVSITNASAMTITLTAAATVGVTFRCAIQNRGAGALTVTPASGTIDGASSLSVAARMGIEVFSDGSNFYTSRGLSSGGGMTNPMTAQGDMIYGGTSGAPTRLVFGTNDFDLSMQSNIPAWTRKWALNSGRLYNTGALPVVITATNNASYPDLDVSASFRTGGFVTLGSDFLMTNTSLLYEMAVALPVQSTSSSYYNYRAVLFCVLDATGGIRIALSGSSLVAAWVIWEPTVFDLGTNAIVYSSRQTALESFVSYAGATTVRIEINAGMNLTSGGGNNLSLRMSQAVASGTSTLKAGSHVICVQGGAV